MNATRLFTLLALAVLAVPPSAGAQTWRADNGNGTYTNPLFFEEFSDPDMIRVGTRFLPHRHHHAQHAGPAGLAFA